MHGFTVAFNEGFRSSVLYRNTWIFLLLSCRVQKEMENLLRMWFEDAVFRIITIFR